MKALQGWRCVECRTIVLERRRKAPPFCPVCKEREKSGGAPGRFEEEPNAVARLDKHDFPPKIVEDPNQRKLPFAEPAARGLF